MLDGVRINGIRGGRQYVLKPDFSAGGVAFYSGTNSDDPSYREAQLWINAVIEDKPPFVLPEQAYAVSQILDGIYESSRTGAPVYFNK
jgi:predicted dehydrogenase